MDRLFFLQSVVVEGSGARMTYVAGQFYHVDAAAAEQFVADGVAETETQHEQRLAAEQAQAAVAETEVH